MTIFSLVCQYFRATIKFFNLPTNCTFRIYVAESKLLSKDICVSDPPLEIYKGIALCGTKFSGLYLPYPYP